jgi:hypothetical protein
LFTRNPVAASAVTGEGVTNLLEAIEEMLQEKLYKQVSFALDSSNGKAQAWIYRHGLVDEVTQENDESLLLHVRMSPANIQRFAGEFRIYPLKIQEELGRVDTNHINNESELDKSCEHDIEFFKSGEDAPKSF